MLSRKDSLQSYGVFISWLVRYPRINFSSSRFIDDVKKIVQKLIQQDFDAAALRKRFQAFIILMFGESLGLLCQLV